MKRSMQNSPLYAAVMGVLCSAYCSSGLAQDAGRPGQRTAPENVIVEGQRERIERSEIAVELEQFGNAVQVVSSDQIAMGGYTNFAEIAQGLIRGANVGYSPDEGEYTIRLDGGGDRDTLVTLDDVPLFDRGPGVEVIWGATLIDSRMIDRVEIFRGGQSLYFGSNGGLGVVNVITKKPDGTVKGDGGLVYGSFNTRELYGNYSFPVSDDGRHSVMMYGSRYASDGHRIFAREAFTDNMARAGGIDNYANSRDNIGFKYRWDIDATSEFLANVQYSQIDFQDTFPNVTIYGAVSSRMPLANVSYSKAWSDAFGTEVTASYRNPTLIHTKVQPEVCRLAEGCPNPDGSGEVVPLGVWTGRLVPQNNQGVGDESIEGGFEEFIATVKNRMQLTRSLEAVIGLQSINYRDDSAAVINIDDSVVSTNAVFLDARITPAFSPSTSISVAGRVDFADSFGSETIWKMGFRQPLGGAGFYVRLNGGTSFSLPQTNELHAVTETVVGNPDLKPERTTSFNGGIGMDRTIGGRRVYAEIGGFHTDIEDRIRTTTGLFPNTRFNDPAVTEIRGLTADLEVDISRNWSASLSYTRQDATPENSDKQIDSTPKWFMTGNLRWASTSNRYHFALLPRYQGPELIAGPLGLPDLDFGSYFLLNGSIGYWGGDDFKHRFQLRFVNLLDRTYGERGAFGDQRFGEAFLRGEISQSDPEFRYPYIFQGKPRSVFLTYSYHL